MHYHFTTADAMREAIARGEFIEHAEVRKGIVGNLLGGGDKEAITVPPTMTLMALQARVGSISYRDSCAKVTTSVHANYDCVSTWMQ